MAEKGRGAVGNREGRFESLRRETFDDGWLLDDEPPPPRETTVTAEAARSIISRNDSPDIPFAQSINPYKGCEHGCIYCYARPSHAYLNLSPGLDFETRLFYKPNAVELLRQELARPGYQPLPINLGANTDPYQPIERGLKQTRGLLEVLRDCGHPVAIITKSALVTRDLDLLADMAARGLATVAISLTTLSAELKRKLEPRAPGHTARLKAMRELSSAGVPVAVLASPIIPFVNDAELEHLLEAGVAHGASMAGMIFLRLPHEVAPLFREWLAEHYPLKAAHVMSLVQQAHGGKDYDPRFGERFTGRGPYVQMLQQRFAVACKRLGLGTSGGGRQRFQLSTNLFRPPQPGGQRDLF